MSLRLRLHPGDFAVLAILALAVLVAAARLPARGVALHGLLALHAALLAGFAAFVAFAASHEQHRLVRILRPALIVSIVFTLYTSLGKLGVVAMPYMADATLSRLDTWLTGVNPALAIQPLQTPGAVEFFSFVYGSFIPYIYLSIILGCLGRPPLERDQFMAGLAFTYAISYVGYLFAPATGPIVFHARDFRVALADGRFHDLVTRGVESTGGLQGAFPSLHVGASVYLCCFDLGTNRLRGLTYLPLVALIYVATVFLRYHYVIDLAAGTVIAMACVHLGRLAVLGWACDRRTAGLPAVPGGE